MESLEFKNKLKELKKNNIAIIGHMGAGKSVVAKMLAKKIDFQHIDSDYEITRFTMKSINKIFQEKGEEYFRNIETEIVLKLIEKKNQIVLREELANKEFDETELRKVDVQITRLRQKIEINPKHPQYIKTIRGKGYRLLCNEI